MTPKAFITRIAIPVVLFFAILAVLAWVLQFLPNFVGPTVNVEPARLATFPVVKAQWKDESQRLYEIGDPNPGKYDFHFAAAEELEIGLESIGCSCTEFKIAVFPDGATDRDPDKLPLSSWKALKAAPKGAEPDVFTIAKGADGVARMSWHGEEPKEIELEAKLWIQPKGSALGRQYQELTAKVQIVRPVQFGLPVELGKFSGQQSGQTYCWSLTRDKLEIAIDDYRKSPNFSYKIRPMLEKDIPWVEARMKAKNVKAMFKAKYMIDVTVTETVNGSSLDQGHFAANIPIVFEGREYNGAPVIGYIQTHVEVIGAEVEGKLDLGRENQKNFDLTSEPDTVLTLVDYPETLDSASGPGVTLTRKIQDSTRNSWSWGLQIKVPSGTPIRENSAVLVRSQALPDYLADIANVASWGTGQSGGVPNLANFAHLIGGRQGKARNVRLPILTN